MFRSFLTYKSNLNNDHRRLLQPTNATIQLAAVYSVGFSPRKMRLLYDFHSPYSIDDAVEKTIGWWKKIRTQQQQQYNATIKSSSSNSARLSSSQQG